MPHTRRLRRPARRKSRAATSCPPGTSSTRSDPCGRAVGSDEDALLASCYRTALDLASEHDLTSIAYPAISTGIYGFPADRAARIAVGTVTAELAESGPRSRAWCSAVSQTVPRRSTSRPASELGLA